MGKKEKNLPAKREETAVVNGSISDILVHDSQGRESGFENVKNSDVAIPFIYILQTLSPQVKKGMPQRVEGAEEGMFFNNVTLEVINPPLFVIPCAFQKAFVEWVPRESGGGFVMQHPDEAILKQCTRNEKNLDILPNGNHVVATAYHFVLLVRGDRLERAVISMTRTQLKKSRRWLSQMMNLQIKGPNNAIIRPPMYSHSYEFGSALETKDQYSWQGFTIGNAKLLTSKDQYLQARMFHQECVAGTVKVKEPEQETPGADTGNSDVM